MPVTDHHADFVATVDDAPGSHVANAQEIQATFAAHADYAASPQLPQRLCWITDNARKRLVWRHDVHAWRCLGRQSNASIWNAELQIIARLDPADCWLTPITTPLSTLEDARLVCRLSAPDNDLLRADFERAIANVNALMNDPLVHGYTSKTDVLFPDDKGVKLRLRHVPFVVRCLLTLIHGLQPNTFS